MTRVLYRDCRHPDSHVCKDMRHLFFARFGLDFRRFVREGMTVEELRQPGQHLDKIDALERVALAREARDAVNG